MSAGLPGLGLGGLFFIISALLAPVPELWKTLRGRSGLAAWRVIGRQFAQAAAMIVGIDLTIRLVYGGLSITGLGDVPPADTGTVLPLTLIGITFALLVAVMGTAKLAELAVRIRTAELPRVPDALPRPAPLRALAIGGSVAMAWFALLAGGASELSPLVKPRGDGTGVQLPDGGQRSLSNPAVRPIRHVTEASTGAITANPSAAEGQQPAADAGHGGDSNSVARPALQPPVPAAPSPEAPAPAPIPEGRSRGAAPPTVVPSPGSGGSGSEPPSDATPTHATGPPATAGPPEGSPAPEHAGPPPHAGRSF